jgi:D-threo-aldose 1-dehydrogenase
MGLHSSTWIELAATAAAAVAAYVTIARRASRQMRYRRAAPTVDRLLFGASTLAGFTYAPCDREMATEAVRCAIDLGIRAFDTAPHYGLGLSEARLGEALGQHAGDRACRVWTKVGRYLMARGECDAAVASGTFARDAVEWENMQGHPGCIFPDTDPTIAEVADYTAAGASRAHMDSVRRLQLSGRVRLAGQRIHDPDTDARCEAALARDGAVAELVRRRAAGEIEEVSIGCWSLEHIRRMLRACPRGTFDSVMIAGRWNLLDTSGYELLLDCQQLGVRVHNASIFASGLLAGGTTYQNKQAPPEIAERARRWSSLARKYGSSLPAVALHFALLPEVVELAAIGMRSSEEVEKNVRFLGEPVDPRIWSEAQREGLLPAHISLPSVAARA